MDSSWIARYFDNNGLHHWHSATKQRPVSEHLWSPRYWIDRRWQAGVSELYEVSVRTWSTVLLGWYPCFWIHSRHWFIPAVKPQAWPGDRKLDWSGRIWRGVLQHVVIPFWDLCLDVQRTNNFFKKIADIEQVCFEDLLFFGDLAACRCRTCLPLVVSLRIIQLRVMTSRATWTPGRRSCCRPKIRFPHCTPDDWNNIYLERIKIIDFEKWNFKSQQERLFCKDVLNISSRVAVSSDANHRRTRYLPSKLLRLL